MRHLSTALHVACEENPLSEYPKLIKLHQKNGVLFVNGKSSDKACGVFIDVLAKCMKDYISKILGRVDFFSLLFDGSQPRKTGTEKELVYAKVVVSCWITT